MALLKIEDFHQNQIGQISLNDAAALLDMPPRTLSSILNAYGYKAVSKDRLIRKNPDSATG